MSVSFLAGGPGRDVDEEASILIVITSIMARVKHKSEYVKRTKYLDCLLVVPFVLIGMLLLAPKADGVTRGRDSTVPCKKSPVLKDPSYRGELEMEIVQEEIIDSI